MSPIPGVAAEAVERLKAVFKEIPGTELTPADAARLAGLERTVCGALLRALEDARFLVRRRNGRFMRRSADSPIMESW
jgi:hypothetical protein